MGAFKLLHGRAAAGSGTANITVGTAANRQLVSDVLPQVLAFPSGNTVSVTKTLAGAGLVEMTRGARFDLNPTLMGAPAAAYTGVEGSGWNGTRPTQPTITTGAPGIRFVSLQDKRFTGTWDMVAIADDPTVIASVDWMVEGTTVNQTAQKWVYYTDVNGIRRKVYGYAIRLTASNYTGFATDKTRGIEVYCRANPVDATLQARVIGVGATRAQRHFLVPALRQYGARIQVKQSQVAASAFFVPATPGADVEAIFNTWQGAISYAIGLTTNTATGAVCASANCGINIEIAENSTIEMVDGGSGVKNAVRAYINVTAAAGVTSIVWRRTTAGATLWDPGQFGIEWVGLAHHFDHTHFSGFTTSPSFEPDRYWWRANGVGADQCDWDMFDHLDDTGNPRDVAIWHEVEDCDFLKWHHVGQFNTVNGYRGATWRNYTTRDLSHDDIDNGAQAIYGKRVIRATADPFRNITASITLQYIGGGTSPGFVKTAADAATSFNIALRFYAPDGTTQIGTDLLIPAPGTGKRFYDLVDIINNVGGTGQAAIAAAFRAVSSVARGLNDRLTDRWCGYLDDGAASGGVIGSHQGAQNNIWGPTAVSATAPTQFYSFVDDHMDDLQTFSGSNTPEGGYTNVVRVDCQSWGYKGIQTKFYDSPAYSFVDRNQFYENDTQSVGDFVVAHISNNKQGYHVLNISDPRTNWLWGDGSTTWTDAYIRAESIVAAGSSWASNVAKSVPTITDSMFNSFSNPAPATSSNALSGLGDYTVMYPGLASRDPRPAGPLLTHLITPHFPFDAWGVEGGTSNVMGAKFLPPDLSSITGADAAELAVVALGADACTYTISGYTGVGNAGALMTLTLNVTGIDN